MENQQPYDRDREIDLALLSGKLKGYITRTNDAIFDGILFLKRNLLLLFGIVVLGGVLGYFLDKGDKPYEQRLVVMPNFESVDYLYENVNLISQKLKEGDSIFLKGIGIKDKKLISKIEVEPVIEIYDFIEKEEEHDRNLQVFKLMAENDNIKDIMEDMPTARNYSKHLVTITTVGSVAKEQVVTPVMDFLNNDSYFNDIKTQYVTNVTQKLAVNDSVIKQVDVLINDYLKDRKKDPGSNLVFYNDNIQINELIKTKNQLTEENGELRVDLVNYQDIIKTNSVALNMKGEYLKMKFVLPAVFLVLFLLFVMARSYYRTQMNRRKIIVSNE